MALQTFPLSANATVEIGSDYRLYTWSGDACPVVSSGLVEGGGLAYIRELRITSANVILKMSATPTGDPDLAGPHFTDAVESNTIELTIDVFSRVMSGSNDPTEPYTWTYTLAQFAQVHNLPLDAEAFLDIRDGLDNAATISSISLTSSPTIDDTYGPRETVQLTVVFSEAVNTRGVGVCFRTRIGADGSESDWDIEYVSGEGTDTLVFERDVAAADVDADGLNLEDYPVGGVYREFAQVYTSAGDVDTNFGTGGGIQSEHKIDGSLLLLDAFDTDTWELDLGANIEVRDILVDNQSRVTLYATDPRGDAGDLLQGEVGLSDDETKVTRIRLSNTANSVTINDNDLPTPLGLQTYFSAGGNGDDLFLFIQTDSRLIRSKTIGGSGGGYVRFMIDDEGDRAELLALANGDRFLFVFARPVDVPFSVGASTGTPDFSVSANVQLQEFIRIDAHTFFPDVYFGFSVVDPHRIEVDASTGIPEANVELEASFKTEVTASTGAPEASVELRHRHDVDVLATTDIPSANVDLLASHKIEVAASAGTPEASIELAAEAELENSYIITSHGLYSYPSDISGVSFKGTWHSDFDTVGGATWFDDGSGNGKELYVAEYTNSTWRTRIWRINPAFPADESGRYGNVGEINQSIRVASLLAWEGNLYVYNLSASPSYRVESLDTLAATSMGQFPPQAGTSQGILAPGATFVFNGNAYIIDTDDRELWTFDPDLPSGATRVGRFPSGMSSPEGATTVGNDVHVISGRRIWEADVTTPADSVELTSSTLSVTGGGRGLASPRSDSAHSEISASTGIPTASVEVRSRHDVDVDASTGIPTAAVEMVVGNSLNISASAGIPSANVEISLRHNVEVSASAGTPESDIHPYRDRISLGGDQTVTETDEINLSQFVAIDFVVGSSASSYFWERLSGPRVTIPNPRQLHPGAFDAPYVTVDSDIVFRLHVTFSDGVIDTQDVTWTIENDPLRQTDPTEYNAISFVAPAYSTSANWIGWEDEDDGLVEVTSLRDGGATSHMTRLRLFTGGNISKQGQVQVYVTDDLSVGGQLSGNDLLDAWVEYAEAITIQVTGLDDLVIAGPNATGVTTPDTTEAYTWKPGNGIVYGSVVNLAALQAWRADFVAGTTLLATIILDDGTGFEPAAVTYDDIEVSASTGEPTANVLVRAVYNEISLELPEHGYSGGNFDRVEWRWAGGVRPDWSALSALGVPSFGTLFQTRSDTSRVLLSAASSQTGGGGPAGPDFSDAFELYNSAITVTAPGLDDLVMGGPNDPANDGTPDSQDPDEPYAWFPGTNARYGTSGTLADWVTDFVAAYDLDNTLRATLILDDGVVPAAAAAPSTVEISASTGAPSADIAVNAVAPSNVEISAETGEPAADITVNAVAPSNVEISAATGAPAADIRVEARPQVPFAISAETGAPAADITVNAAAPSNVEISAATGAPAASIRPQSNLSLNSWDAPSGETAVIRALFEAGTGDIFNDSGIGTASRYYH